MISTGDLSQLSVLLSILGVPQGGGGGGAVTQEEVQRFAFNYSAATGSGDAYTVTLYPAPSSYVDGLIVSMIANHTNDSTNPTLQVNSLDPLPIVASLGEDVAPEDITDGQAYLFVYNGDNNNFQLLNPSISDANSYLVQLNYFNSNPDIGTQNAYEVNLNLQPGGDPYGNFLSVYMIPSLSNDGASTLSVNGGEAIEIVLPNGQSLVGREIIANQLCLIQYDFLTEKFVLLTPNPSSSYVTLSASTLTNGFNLGSLTTGLLKNTVTDGVAALTTAVNGADYWAPGDVITLPGMPTNSNDATSKAYVDSVAAGLNPQESCYGASTENLAGYTYDNGMDGVGATLTAGSNGAFSADGLTFSGGERWLYKDDSTGSGAYNGVYVLTTLGDGSTPAVLTRAANFDTPENINNSGIVPIQYGTVNAGTMWLNVSTITTVGTDPISFVQFGQVAGIIGVPNGGTGLSSLTPYAPLVGGTASTSAMQQVTTGLATSNLPMVSQGSSLSPIFSGNVVLYEVLDTNNLPLLQFNTVPNAVNYWQMYNSATGIGLSLVATGSDTDIQLNFGAKGAGAFRFQTLATANQFTWYTGTANQSVLNWNLPNSSQNVTVTTRTTSGTMAYLTDIPVNGSTFYANQATTNVNSLTTVVYTNVINDSAGGYSSGVYTIPATGWYIITGGMQLNSYTYGNGAIMQCHIYRNGTGISGQIITPAAYGPASGTLNVSTTYYCTAGDTISIQATANLGGGTNTLNGSAENFFSVLFLHA